MPTEQDIVRAIAYWHPHSGAEPGNCVLGQCFCCDLAGTLANNAPFVAILQSILEQLHVGRASETDAVVSAYAFGLLTAEIMEKCHAESASATCRPRG
jgi:hypothetical protein